VKPEQDILYLLEKGKTHEAMSILMSNYKRFVHSTAMRYLKDDEDAKDVTQDVFIKAYNSLDYFRGDSKIQTWLYAITRNLCLNALDKKKRKGNVIHLETLEVLYDERSDRLVNESEFSKFFKECMSILPEKQRETFILRHVEELTYEEISEMLGTSIGGLKANYYQAVQKLSQYLSSKKEGNIQ
jgi:RNA polymerase sigma-70 factor (ECF subfamily)